MRCERHSDTVNDRVIEVRVTRIFCRPQHPFLYTPSLWAAFSQWGSFSRNRDGTITFSACRCEHLRTVMRATGIFLPQTTETSRLAQYLDVESEPDMIDITSDTSSSMEEEGNWTPPELQGSPPPEPQTSPPPELQGSPPPLPQGSPPPELQGSPPTELQGGAGASDADFDADMYPQPDRTVSCASPARTTTMTLFLRTR